MAGGQLLHVQLKESVLDAIASGEYAPGTRLPSQRDLCREYGISHMTVRRAINELVAEGVIYAVPGKGIFVSRQSKTVEYGSLQGFAQQLARVGMEPSTNMLEARLTAASTVMSQLLKVPAGAPLVFLRRLRLADGRPHSVTASYLPHALCPNILEQDRLVESLFTVLRDVYRLSLSGSDNVISTVLADEETAVLLQLQQPAPLLVHEQITFLESGQPIEFSRTLTNGEENRLQFKEGLVPD